MGAVAAVVNANSPTGSPLLVGVARFTMSISPLGYRVKRLHSAALDSYSPSPPPFRPGEVPTVRPEKASTRNV